MIILDKNKRNNLGSPHLVLFHGSGCLTKNDLQRQVQTRMMGQITGSQHC